VIGISVKVPPGQKFDELFILSVNLPQVEPQIVHGLVFQASIVLSVDVAAGAHSP
jgi:hypothetical protein